MDQDSVARTLTVLGLLQSRRCWTAAELAQRCGVSARTLRRDVNRLRYLGYTVIGRPGPGGSYALKAGLTVPPLLFTAEEVSAIVAGLRLIEPLLDGDASATALAKLQQVLPAPLARVAEVTDAATDVLDRVDALATTSVLTVVADLIAENGRMRFDYVDGQGRRSKRIVDPHRQLLRGGRWYLVGYDLDREAWRLFRLDRVSNSHRIAGVFAPHVFPAATTTDWLTTDFGRITTSRHAQPS